MHELQEKRDRLLGFMEEHHLDAVVLNRVANFAWYTCGVEPVVMLSSERAEAAIVVERDRQFVLCNSVEYPRLREEEALDRRGFEFRVSPWYETGDLLSGAVRGRRWAADWPLEGCEDLSREIARLRYQLTAPEIERYRSLGQRTGMALERSARGVQPGMSEAQIAGTIAAEALSEGVTPTLLLVGADDRVFHYRHPIPTARKVERHCMLVLCARHQGLVASATRLVHFGELDNELRARERACAYVDAVFIANTRIGASLADIFSAGERAYAESGFGGEWQKHFQGGAAGYESRDYEATPNCREIVLADQAFAWNPSITGVKSEDTVIVQADGVEFLTATGNWPSIGVEVAGRTWDRPAILVG